MSKYEFLKSAPNGYFKGVHDGPTFDIYMYQCGKEHGIITIPREFQHKDGFSWNYREISEEKVTPKAFLETPQWFQELVSHAKDVTAKRFRLLSLYE